MDSELKWKRRKKI